MNNENNGMNNLGQNLNPAPMPEQTPITPAPVSEVPVAPAPVLENPVGPVGMASTPAPTPAPMPEAPVAQAPVLENPVGPVGIASTPTPTPAPMPAAPVAPAPVLENPVGPVGMASTPAPTPAPMPAAPTSEMAPTMGANSTQPVTSEETKKKNNMVLIIVIVAVVLIGAGVGLYFILSGNEDKNNDTSNQNNNNANNNQPASNDKQTEFLNLANKYVSAVDKMWKEDKMICENATDFSQFLKPSELSTKDQYQGSADYYVFINTVDESEMKIDVDDNTAVAGWIRINKESGKYYVALSDGTNYIVDAGYRVNKPSSTELTANDVITTGNGSNYQYYGGLILGHATNSDAWGVGDYKIMTDGDDTNDGIYSQQGPKTGSYTAYCTNIAG